MLKFSLLISVYNGSKYLGRLFGSLLKQDIPLSDYEIVCIDDCSSDDSVKIIQEYQSQFPNVRLMLNEKNCRVATNVNKLTACATGKYFWLIGQDDYIEDDCLGMLWERLEKESLDVLLFNYKRVAADETVLQECKVFTSAQKHDGVSFLKSQFADRDYCQYVLGFEWRGVYRTDYWRGKEIRCVDGMNYEDTVIMLKAIVYSSAVASIDEMLYYYRLNSGSISFKENFIKRGDLIYEFAFVVGDEVEDFYYQLLSVDGSLADSLRMHLIKRYNNYSFDLIRTTKEYKKEFYNRVSKNREFVDSKRKWLNVESKLLILPFVGFPIACVCEWIYRLKKSVLG